MRQFLSTAFNTYAPPSLKRAWFATRERIFLLQNRTTANRFEAIYRQRLWKNPESASGYGSTMLATKTVRASIEQLIGTHGILSILDAPCGDFNWMSQVQFEGKYVGCDIVADLIARNQERFGNGAREFCQRNICHDPLPVSDLVLCRECLNHLSLAEAQLAIANLTRAARKILVLTHHPTVTINVDQTSSFRFRPLNFTCHPFGLRAPDALIDEREYEPGKTLAVWDLSRGPVR